MFNFELENLYYHLYVSFFFGSILNKFHYLNHYLHIW